MMLRLTHFPLAFPSIAAPKPLAYRPGLNVVWMPNWWLAPRPSSKGMVPHHAIDISVASGTPVVSVSPGRVLFAGWEQAGGWSCMIASELDNGATAVSYYAHMHARPVVVKGEPIDAGALIGVVGSTGYSEGPHLHFTVFVESRKGAGDAMQRPQNPYPQLLALSIPAGKDPNKRVVADDATYLDDLALTVRSAWAAAVQAGGAPRR